MKKVLLQNKPNFGEISQYNFSTNDTAPFSYDNSTSIPENNDQFQNKDLQTTSYGSIINEYIIENNLKYSGSSNVTIKELRIDNAGVNYDLENIEVRGWFFSKNYFVNSNSNPSETLPEDAGYGTLNNVLNGNDDTSRFYLSGFSDRSDGSNLGDITAVMDGPIISNFEEDGNIQISSFVGGHVSLDNLTNSEKTPFPTGLNEESANFLVDSVDENPLYFCFWMKGDADRWSGTDKREKRFQVYKIDNLQFFPNGDGTAIEIDFPNGDADNRQDGGGGGSSWSAQAPAFIITKFKVLIDVVSGTTNNNIEDEIAKEISKDVIPRKSFVLSELNNISFFNNFNPLQQLNNSDLDGNPQSELFPNFFPLTTINIDGDTQQTDIQSYYSFESEQSIRASSPCTVKINFNLVEESVDSEVYTELNQNIDYLYFVVRWDDVNDEIKTIENFLEDKPDNNVELLRRQQNENIYIPNIIEAGENTTINYTNYGEIKNVYNTPGIKTIKIIMVTFDKNTNQLGRWKLIKSRFYLDIPLNQYPDFGEVGGDDYITIPWPFTTAIIGGVDNNSKYKQSVQNTLSSGKIGDTDIIDERFLISDLNNDELGQSITKMDLEQCRYFNKPYSIYDLLNIDAVINSELIPFDNLYYDGDVNKFPMESSVGQIFISDNQDLDLKQSCKLELNGGEISDKSIIDTSGNSNKGLLIGDYKIKKIRKGEPMRRDSFIKVPKKTGNQNGAL